MTRIQAEGRAQHPLVQSNISLLTAWIESQMAYAELPGLALAIVAADGVVWQAGFGYADVASKRPMTPQTVFRVGSITKLFTATAIMQLRDAGRLRLDDPVEAYLPWFRIQGRTAPITLRHLLSHTSGLPREATTPYWTTAAFPSADAIRAALPKQSVAIAPDTKLKYSNLALALAGFVVETASGMPYVDYVTTRILRPLGMETARVSTPPTDEDALATGYGRRLPGQLARAVAPLTDARGLEAAFNLSASVLDLARFAQLQFGTQADAVLAPGTIREMHRPQWVDASWRHGVGLGFSLGRSGPFATIGHGGAVLGYRAQLTIAPSERFAVIALANADDASPARYVGKALKWVAPALREAARSTGPSLPAPDAGWTRYVGRYRNAWRDEQVLVYKGDLIMVDPTQDDPLASWTRLVPAGAHQFRREEPAHSGGRHGEMLSFDLDDIGEVIRLRYGGHELHPVAHW